MIYASNRNFKGQFSTCEPIKRVIEFVESKGKELAVGDYPLGNDGLYVQIREMQPVPVCEKQYETHLKNIDMQMLIEGDEYIWVHDLTPDMTVVEDLPERDLRFHKNPSTPGMELHIEPGSFCLLMPDDAHTDGICNSSKIKKAIAKIPVGLIKF